MKTYFKTCEYFGDHYAVITGVYSDIVSSDIISEVFALSAQDLGYNYESESAQLTISNVDHRLFEMIKYVAEQIADKLNRETRGNGGSYRALSNAQ